MQPPRSTTTGANGAPTGDDDAGGGESEPANDPNKTSLNSKSGPITLNNPMLPADNSSSPPASSKFPKSPKSPNGTARPQISVHIQPATPKSSVALPPGSVTDLINPKSAGGYSTRSPSTAHDAVQSWVQSQGVESADDAASKGHGSSKRDSNPLTSPYVRNRRPSESSQKSGKEKDILRPPSAAGSASGGGFSLSQLLSTGPKLSRRNSASSKKSVSSGKSGKSGKAGSVKGGSVKGGSTGGDSGLESKYGIHGKLTVGKGATSIVRLAHKWDRTDEDRLYAVKEFRPRRAKETERDYVKKLTSEFCISSSLRHSNVVETVDLMQDQEGKWCEVMEFCPGGDLYAAIRKGGMSPAEVECSFKQILTGVGYLHQQGVAHRDLKPENLFFDARGQVKIGDFGASTVFRLPWESTTHKSSGLCGSEPYIAPEQFTQQQSYDARLVDVWACGIVYYCLHFSELPWSSAQASDKTYAQYAQQCASPALSIAGIPFLKHVVSPSVPTTPGASGPGTPARQISSGSTPTLHMTGSGSTTGLSRKETEREQHKEQTAPYPTTIQHLSPRACRPVLRRMLEPKPELRVLIEDVLRHPWIQQIEVCTEPGVVPKHIHPTPVATAAAGGIVVEK